jgi:hypothetical protein
LPAKEVVGLNQAAFHEIEFDVDRLHETIDEVKTLQKHPSLLHYGPDFIQNTIEASAEYFEFATIFPPEEFDNRRFL